MMASDLEIFEALYGICVETNSTQFVDDIIQDGIKAISQNKDGTISTIQSSSVNGKSFSKITHATPFQLINMARSARRAFLGEDSGPTTTTVADFRGLWR